jgi:hypothetical protein
MNLIASDFVAQVKHLTHDEIMLITGKLNFWRFVSSYRSIVS